MGHLFESIKLREIGDYFKGCSARGTKGVYFYRLNDYNSEIRAFLIQYLEETKKCGVYINGKIQNPTEQQLAYYEEIMGDGFRLEERFFDEALRRWLPRLDAGQRNCITASLLHILSEMQKAGKNANIQKNAYIKFMCWLYYKFERILNHMGKERLPKILYEGYVTDYELKMLRILSGTGCDILLLQTAGDEAYLKVDRESRHSRILQATGSGPFPKGFSIPELQRELDQKGPLSEMQVEQPEKMVSTNTWLTGDLFSDSLKEPSQRGVDKSYYYNMFVRIRGVEEPGNYQNDLFRWKAKLESQKRTVVLVEKIIRVPGVDETAGIKRKSYRTAEQLLFDLSSYLIFPKNRELEKLAKKSFFDVLTEENQKEGAGLTRLSNRAICLICWINRYLPQLFPQWKIQAPPVFLFYGVCSNENEAVWLRFLSKMPVDVFEICPNLNLPCRLADRFLFDRTYENSLPLEGFPTQVGSAPLRTVAYNAEQDLNTVLYQDTGLYRNKQFKKAIPMQLKTTYEEIAILWDQESKFRPGFDALGDRVMVPVICAKVSGVPGSDVYAYWQSISKLITEETVVLHRLPYINDFDPNPVKAHTSKFIRNRKLQFETIKRHPVYQYGFLREDMQDYMLDKLQECIDRGLIEGTFRNGAEYTVLAVALNLNKGFLRLIQKYDFTKKVPKLIIISTGEVTCTLGDSILTAYLSLLGFDIAVFTPTGYQNVEANFTQPILTEHQVGDYMYDLQAPNFKTVSRSSQKESLRDKLFRRMR